MGHCRLFSIFVLFLNAQLILCAPPLIEYKEEFHNPSERMIAKSIDPRNRLPETVKPIQYDLEIRTILDDGGNEPRYTAPSKISIKIQCLAVTNSISLHALDLDINNSSITIHEEETSASIAIENFANDPEKELFIINLGTQLEVGKKYFVYIEYVAHIITEEGIHYGFYRSSYKTNTGVTRNLAITDFEPADARRVFPCFDEPHLKAIWKISIIHLPQYHSLSNGVKLTADVPVPELPGWVKDTFEETPPISSYLVCFAVSDFTSKAATAGLYDQPVTIWGPPPLMERNGGDYSPDISAKLLKFLEEYYDVPSYLTKMDKISIPDYTMGAMENWGLNTYRESRLLYIEGLTTIQDKVSMTNTISHELVHQWFGNLVTMEWWDDLWLNEGFASFYASIGVKGIGIDDHAPMENLVLSVHTAMQADVLPTTRPIHSEVIVPTGGLFDSIIYSKGSSIVRMMNSFLTEDIMKHGLTNFLEHYEYENARQDDLFNEINGVALAGGRIPQERTFKQIMDTWTRQSGFPVVKVTRNSDGSVRFDQSKFVVDYPGSPIDAGELWDIPLSYRLQGATFTSSVWMLSKNLTMRNLGTEGQWILVNPEEMGYYRVQYDSRNLNLIIEQLLTNHAAIDELTRSALIDDNLNLAFSGQSNLGQALRLTTYLNKERNLTPWASFVTNMAAPYRMFGRSAAFTSFKKYILGLMTEPLVAIGIDPQPGEPIANATLLRNRLFEWTCNLGYAPCITYAQQKFTAWTQNPELTQTILPDLQASVYCTAVANGGDMEWNFVLEQYHVAERDTAKVNLIRALGCAKSSFRLNRLLDLALNLNSGLEAAHRVTALQAVAGNSAGVELTFNFIRNNFETLVRRYGVGIFSSTVSTLSNYFNNQFDLADLNRFIASNSEVLAPVEGSLNTSRFNINKNILWEQRNTAEFRAFMEALP